MTTIISKLQDLMHGQLPESGPQRHHTKSGPGRVPYSKAPGKKRYSAAHGPLSIDYKEHGHDRVGS